MLPSWFLRVVRRHFTYALHFTLRILIALLILEPSASANAAPLPQVGDPVAQCAEGVQLVLNGKYAEAMPLLEAGYSNRDVAAFVNPEDLGVCALLLAYLYVTEGKNAKALEANLVALEIFKESGNREFEAVTLDNIGLAYTNQGRYAEALEYYQQALAIMRERHNRVGEGSTLSEIGGVYVWQGRYAEALEYYQQALAIMREMVIREGEGAVLNNIGGVYFKQFRYAEALDYYQKAMTIFQELGDLADEGAMLQNIGAVYTHQFQYNEALKYYQQSLTIFQENNDRVNEGKTLNNIGLVYYKQQRYSEALGYYEQTLAIMQEVDDPVNEGLVLNNIGAVYDMKGQYPEALAYYEQAMILLEAVRASAGIESARTSFIAQYSFLYDRAVVLYYQQGQPEKAFLTSERGRARAFLDSMTTGYVELSDNTAVTLYVQEQEAYTIRQATNDALTQAKVQNPPDAQLISDLEAQLAQAEKDYQAALDAITAYGGQLAQLVPGRSTVLDLPQTQTLLDDQTTLLSFWVLDDQTLVFIITQNNFRAVSLPISRTDLYAQIEAFRTSFATTTNTAYPDSAVTLYQALIAPIKSYLTTPNLVIIPHGELHYLPFAALMDGSHYLIDYYSITYLPSVSAWPYIKQNTGHANASPLILGNPDTGNTDLKPLPFAENEAQAIASLFNTTPLLGKDATETAVYNQAGQTSILHLAAHANYNPINPLYSTIYLAPDSQNDGALETHEIYSLKLNNADLVVLSGCDTQLGQLSTGDDLVGMTRAFFFAGTPSVLASLWRVDDKVTQLLMEKFYTYWRSGMGKAEALKQAQTDIRNQYPNPYYWAAFVLNGDGGKSALAQTATPVFTPTFAPTSAPANAPIPILSTLYQSLLPILIGMCTCVGLILVLILFIIWRLRKRKRALKSLNR